MRTSVLSLVTIVALLWTAPGFGQGSKWDKHAPPRKADISCQTCHAGSAPTKTNPALLPCPRSRILPGFHPDQAGPEVLIMSKVSKEYGPVVFSHKLHAEMSTMSGGCYGCHHYNSTSMTILSCRECHPANRARTDISMPDLKGAYHRQCMDCHRQWSKATDCQSCHLKRDARQSTEEALQAARLKGKSHPELQIPKRVVYETRSQRGSFVTFFHNDHAERFSLACSDCHKSESCVRCHARTPGGKASPDSLSRKVKTQRTMEALHAPCFSCHGQDKCEECHVDQPREAFDHAKSAGWALNRFHRALSCQECHGQSKRFTKVDTKCVACHKGWTPGSFKHEITSLKLDATHRELDCESCHLEGNFANPPSCAGCHDDKAYPAQKPGATVKTAAK